MKEGPLTEFFQPPDTVWTPHVLKDGSDSVGALGALNRVYLNIGLFSEEWLLHFNALVGGKPITPIEIAVARKNSAYWRATEAQTPSMALFFLKSATPHHLKDAPGGAAYLTKDTATLTEGKMVFAERCARCHSSKAPPRRARARSGRLRGSGLLSLLDSSYWEWTKTDEFKQQMRQIVMADDFLNDNFLSTDVRVPVTLLETNACSPLATNAIAGNIWDNFSSQSYKDLPSVGTITVYDPFTGEPQQYEMPAGGRGYTRPASLISLWSTAPFLLNNSVGKFDPSPSVEARIGSFTARSSRCCGRRSGRRMPCSATRSPASSTAPPRGAICAWPAAICRRSCGRCSGRSIATCPGSSARAGVADRPDPRGACRSTCSATSSSARRRERDGPASSTEGRSSSCSSTSSTTCAPCPPQATDEEARRQFAALGDRLLKLSKCPDFVVNRGHYFGTDAFKEEPGLSDDDKRALIEFLKTF